MQNGNVVLTLQSQNRTPTAQLKALSYPPPNGVYVYLHTCVGVYVCVCVWVVDGNQSHSKSAAISRTIIEKLFPVNKDRMRSWNMHERTNFWMRCSCKFDSNESFKIAPPPPHYPGKPRQKLKPHTGKGIHPLSASRKKHPGQSNFLRPFKFFILFAGIM